MTRFDLDHFVPHPPGYPVYVALLRLAALVVHDPVWATNAVALACGLGTIVFVAAAAARMLGARTAAWIGGFVAFSPLVWRASSGVGSEAPALVFAAAALFGATCSDRAAPWWIGVAVGLGLGVRVSWAPLYLALLVLAPRRRRVQTIFVALAATAAWGLPFLIAVGPKHLAAIARTHARGHFEVWGGTVIREPGAMRAVWLARDLFVDGLGVDRDPLGLAIAALLVALALVGFRAWRARDFSHARFALLPLPYLAWIALGQNLHQQPRHALPVVVFLAALLALAAASSRHGRAVGAPLLALVALRTAIDAHARRTIPPPGAQLVALAHTLPGRVAVYAGPSARFFDLDGTAPGFTVATLGDARLALSHLPSLPQRALVTSELDGLATSPYPLVPLATLCRPPRIDRRTPCLDVFDWRAPFLGR